MGIKSAWLVVTCAHVFLVAAAPQTGPQAWKQHLETARMLAGQGKYSEVEQHYTAALAEARKFGDKDPRLATSLYDLAQFYRSQARYPEAERLFKEALAIQEGFSSGPKLDTANSLHGLANTYRAQGKYAEAEPLYKQSLAFASEALGPGHPDLNRFSIPEDTTQAVKPSSETSLAVNLNNLADLYRAQGKYAEAEPLYKRALDIAEKNLEPTHPSIALCLNNLADLYTAEGKFEEAEPLYERALSMAAKADSTRTPGKEILGDASETTLTHGSPDESISLNNLADLKRATGKTAEAEELYKRALQTEELQYGKDHPNVAGTLNNLADLYLAENRKQEADALYKRADQVREKSLSTEQRDLDTYRQALAIDEKALGSWHPDIAIDLNNLADIFRAQGRYSEAEPLYRRSLAIAETSLGPNHPGVIQCINNLADLYRAQGKYAEAEPLFKRALALAQKANPVESPAPQQPKASVDSLQSQQLKLSTHLNNLADFYRAQGRYSDAEPLYWKALAMSEKALGAGNPKLAVTLNNLGDLYRAQGRRAEAEPLYKRALAIGKGQPGASGANIPFALSIEQETAGANKVEIARDLSLLADQYVSEGRYSQAEDLYKQSLRIQTQILGEGHPETTTQLAKYARLLNQAGRKDEAQKIESRIRGRKPARQ